MKKLFLFLFITVKFIYVQIKKIMSLIRYNMISNDQPLDKMAFKSIIECTKIAGGRKPYIIGAVLGCLQLKKIGLKKATIIEFGVAKGEGLIALINISKIISKNLKMDIEVIGFDNRTGLPELKAGYKDHPEIWSFGEFEMGESYTFLNEFIKKTHQKLIIGDIEETLKKYKLDNDSTLSFVVIDVDLYSSTKPILEWINTLSDEQLLPATPIYFDDVLNMFMYSEYAGEALAINEFNKKNKLKKIELKASDLKLYALHNFNSPFRTGAKNPLSPLTLFIDQLKTFYWK